MKQFIHAIRKFISTKLLMKILGLGFVLNMLAGTLLVGTIWGGFFGLLPTKRTLQNIQNDVATEVYTADGQLMGKYYLQERTNVQYEDIPEPLVNALVATEDARFYTHSGIDWRSMGRVIVKTIIMGDRSAGGGSTLSQQLAKNLFPRNYDSKWELLVIKIKEAIIAKRLEKVFSKNEIIALYLNTVPFGENAYGIETAAQRFFSKNTEELNTQEAALLVGMLKANTYYNPRLNPKNAKRRRAVVLRQMEKYNYLKPEESDSLQKLPIDLDYNFTAHYEGPAPYFREWLRNEVQAFVKEYENEDGEPYNVYTDGLKIYTTIDSRMQEYAEEAVYQHMKQLQKSFKSHWGKKGPWSADKDILLQAIYRSKRYKKLREEGKELKEIQEIFKKPVKMKVFTFQGEKQLKMSPLDSVKHYLYFLNAGFMAMEPQSGHIKAWVGGINHKYFKYDHVNLDTRRQVGSTFKPFVYAAALEDGADPCEYIANELTVYEDYEDWTPRNSDNKYGGYYSMKGALTNSVNTISVKLLMDTEADNVVELAQDMGIEHHIEEVPSIALGTASLSLFEMVGAYSTFANRGRRVPQVFITKIEDQHGKLIYEHKQKETEQVISEETAEIITEMMKNVVDSGTARRLRYKYGLRNDIAGKTGTTQSQVDGWFMGITPRLVGGVWVGSDDPRIHFRSLTLGQGANTALPVWAIFMRKVNADPAFRQISKAQFAPPSAQTLELMNCKSFVEELPKKTPFYKKWFVKDPEKIKQIEKEKERRKTRRKRRFKKKKKKFFKKIKKWFGGQD